MRPSEEVRAAVIAAHGGDAPATEVGRAHGLTRGQVIGIWHRRPRDTPEEAARVAARAEAARAKAAKAEAARAETALTEAAVPFTPETPGFGGQKAAAWSALMAGAHAGAAMDDILAALYPNGDRSASWRTIFFATLKEIRHLVGDHGFGVEVVPGTRPSRWRIVRADGSPLFAPPQGETPPSLVSPAPEAAPPPEAPRSPAPVPERPEPAPASTLSGAALAIARLKPRCCRWPLGEPGDEAFRFCGEATAVEGKPYCPAHARTAQGGRWIPGRAA